MFNVLETNWGPTEQSSVHANSFSHYTAPMGKTALNETTTRSTAERAGKRARGQQKTLCTKTRIA